MTTFPHALNGAAMTDPRSRLGRLELVRLVVAYHEAHVRDLSRALTLAATLEARAPTGFPRGLTHHLDRMLSEVVAHQAREERLLSPVLRLGGAPRPSLTGLAADHEAAQAGLERLVQLTCDYAAPAHACGDWRELYDLCRKYDREFREHVQLEERVVFPRLADARGSRS